MQRDVTKWIIIFSCCVVFSCSKTTSVRPIYTPPSPITGKTYSADEITAFKQLTLNATNNIVVKLPRQVAIFLADTGYLYMTKEIDSIISQVNRLLDTNLVLTRTADRFASSLQIHLTDRNTYIGIEPSAAPVLQNAEHTGMAYLHWNDQGIVYRGSIFVDMQKTANDTLQQRYLIHHEIMHAMGFLGHVKLPSIYTVLFYFTVTPYILNYTDFDKHIMQLLYNPSVKAGIKEAEFNEVVKNL